MEQIKKGREAFDQGKAFASGQGSQYGKCFGTGSVLNLSVTKFECKRPKLLNTDPSHSLMVPWVSSSLEIAIYSLIRDTE